MERIYFVSIMVSFVLIHEMCLNRFYYVFPPRIFLVFFQIFVISTFRLSILCLYLYTEEADPEIHRFHEVGV